MKTQLTSDLEEEELEGVNGEISMKVEALDIWSSWEVCTHEEVGD